MTGRQMVFVIATLRGARAARGTVDGPPQSRPQRPAATV